MIAGNKNRFAIEAEISDTSDSWVYGSFRFWIEGNPIGNWEDSAALNACYNWIQSFSFDSEDLAHNELYELPPTEAFVQIMSLIRVTVKPPLEQLPINNPDRFDISVLGMSSFDALDILLIKNEAGSEKCIWRIRDGEVQSAVLSKGEMETVAAEFCVLFEKEAPQLRDKKFRADEN